MKIYPKTRKFQSGGKLSEINFYPTVQYTPTSSVAITQGAWSPLQQTRTKDALLDPELMKGKEMLSNESREYMSNLESKMYEYNSLSEPERQSNKGLSLLASMKGDSAKAVEYVNNYKRNQEAVKSLEPNDSSDIWVTDEYGRHGVKDSQDANKVKWINSVDLYENLNRFKPLSALELTTARGEIDAEVRNTRLDDIAKRTTGRKIWDESLARAATNIGHNQVNSIIQGRYGITPKDDGLNKTRKIERGSLDNKYQIAAASDLALNQMPASDKNGIMATAVQKLFNPNNMRDYIETRSFGYNPETGKTEIQFGRKSFGEVLEQLEGYSKDKNGKVIKTPVPPEEKFKIIENFKRDYLKTYVKNYFDAKTVDENKFSSTFDVASKDIDERMGLENLFKKTEATFDAKAVGDQFVVMGETEAVIFSKNSLTATVHTKPYTGLYSGDGQGVATNIEKDTKFGKVFMNTSDKDSKFKYMVENTETLDGRDLTSYSRDVKNNMYRVGAGDATKGFFKTDQDSKVFAISPKTINTATGNKLIDDISDKMTYYKLKIKADASGKYTREKANEDFNAWAKSQNLIHVPEIVYKTVALVPVNTTNKFDKQLIQGGSNYNALSKDEKETFQNTLNKAASTGVGSSAIDDAVWGVQVWGDEKQSTVNIGGNNYIVVVREVVGISQDLAKIQNISQSKGLEQKATFTHQGDIDLLNAGHIDIINNLIGSSSGVGYDNKIEEKEHGGIIPQFTPQEFKIKPLSLKDLY